MARNSMSLIALCAIALGAAEQRDAQGKVTTAATLQEVQPGEAFTIDAEEGRRLLNTGAARLPLVEGDTVEPKPRSTRTRAARSAAVEEGGGAEAGEGEGEGDPGAEGADPATGEPQGA